MLVNYGARYLQRSKEKLLDLDERPLDAVVALIELYIPEHELQRSSRLVLQTRHLKVAESCPQEGCRMAVLYSMIESAK
ncbi:MAG: hypothetical protein KA296_11955 [Marinobacter sp.]|nr:hypothetical protein [Marinobacter sp.]